MVKVKIERYNNQIEGVGYTGGKVIFVPKTKVGDIVDVSVTEDKTKYARGKVTSPNTNVDCPYFYECGGCYLRHFSYDESVKLKYNNLKQLFLKDNLYTGDIKVNKSSNYFNYRNKISLKIQNKKIGFYEEKTNSIVEIDECLIARDIINDFLKVIKEFKINNGTIVIRCNYNDELLIIINTDDEIKYKFDKLKENFKIAGVVLNNKAILNDDFIIDKLDNKLFKISYNSFFQVNNLGANKIIDIIKNNLDKDDDILDLYCGVGSIGLAASDKVKSVLGIEIVPNAIKNALFNAKMNNISNANFILGDVSKSLDKIKNDFNAIIVDPPRAGLDQNTINFILNSDAKKIIYVSCNPITLVRDLKIIKDKYNIKSVDMIDMFSYSYHIETVCVLDRGN
ncbi:MAG: class I SAM-dependent RNA methyltransferase [Bacilli bacterium]|nr:class I SAM-dependent RNA methyltransferase [Bacilli bacterium]